MKLSLLLNGYLYLTNRQIINVIDLMFLAFVQVLLLDEITVDLDVLARADLMTFLRSECEERGATIIYATHIFDGLESWPTHIVSLSILANQ